MKNHLNCDCTFVKKVEVKTNLLESGEIYSAQIWKAPGGVEYCRIFSIPGDNINYFKIELSQIEIVA